MYTRSSVTMYRLWKLKVCVDITKVVEWTVLILSFDNFLFYSLFPKSITFPTGDVSMSVLLKWMTGCKSIPVLGFPKQFSATFVHGCKDNCRCRPTTSTCDLLVRIPIHIGSLIEMDEIITSALKDCFGFGCV